MLICRAYADSPQAPQPPALTSLPPLRGLRPLQEGGNYSTDLLPKDGTNFGEGDSQSDVAGAGDSESNLGHGPHCHATSSNYGA